MTETVPVEVLAAWPALSGGAVTPVSIGNINRTFRVDKGDTAAIVQRLHPVFDASVHNDIAAVTDRLAAQGVPTPRLLPTSDGSLYVVAADGVWRAQSFVPGKTHEKLPSPDVARAAGELVGRFHAALDGWTHDYAFTRGNVHNTAHHLQTLRDALATHRDHRLYNKVEATARSLLLDDDALRSTQKAIEALPPRNAHGDLKVSNLRFDDRGQGLCLVDLDTLSRMAWPLEMGDAFRSWCNPRQEDELPARFDATLFAEGIGGYADLMRGRITQEESALLVPAIWLISTELAARFLADALLENYFGFDAQRYRTKGDHHLARGMAMLSLARDVQSQRDELRSLVDHVL